MQFISSKSFVVLASVVVVLGIFVYFAFGRNTPVTDESLLVSELVNQGVGSDLLSTLRELQAIKLNDSIFANVIFTSLSDFGKPIVPEPSGRSNPFAPVNFSTGQKGSTTSISFLKATSTQQ